MIWKFSRWPEKHIWTMLMHKILQNHLLCTFVANLKIGTIYALYPESFCDKNLAIRKVFVFSDSGQHTSPRIEKVLMTKHMLTMIVRWSLGVVIHYWPDIRIKYESECRKWNYWETMEKSFTQKKQHNHLSSCQIEAFWQ